MHVNNQRQSENPEPASQGLLVEDAKEAQVGKREDATIILKKKNTLDEYWSIRNMKHLGEQPIDPETTEQDESGASKYLHVEELVEDLDEDEKRMFVEIGRKQRHDPCNQLKHSAFYQVQKQQQGYSLQERCPSLCLQIQEI
jgi:hypothetical protein